MKYSEAMAKADALRPGTLSDEEKARCIYELDCDMADMMGAEKPAFVWPGEDAELLMEAPHDGIYPLYLTAKIDYANAETDLYENDMAVFGAAYDDAKAWYRRTHKSENKGNWRTM